MQAPQRSVVAQEGARAEGHGLLTSSIAEASAWL